MIGRMTEFAQTAVYLALTIEQLSWPQDEETYRNLREEAHESLNELGLPELVLPHNHDEFVANFNAISTPLTAHLSAERGRIKGDTVALPLFFIQSFSLRYAIHAGMKNPDAGLLEMIEECIEDLGLDRELARYLEREAGWLTLQEGATENEAYLERRDVIRAGPRSSRVCWKSSDVPKKGLKRSKIRWLRSERTWRTFVLSFASQASASSTSSWRATRKCWQH
jgi:hypothetical protein